MKEINKLGFCVLGNIYYMMLTVWSVNESAGMKEKKSTGIANGITATVLLMTKTIAIIWSFSLTLKFKSSCYAMLIKCCTVIKILPNK